ncbi:hypothetical protein K525DRAFT_193724 [Schizophyllum commune Loenen D]|nr:hypothetical protein K525DRAFT_193724 [Schizophyllum commune Loenen D]
MTQPNRPITIVFIPDPLLAHTVTSSGKGGTFEMVQSFGSESVKQLFNAAPGCWLEIEQAAYLPEAWRMLSESREDLSISVVGMDYPQFMGAIMSRSEEDSSWRTLLDADLIVGGAALNEDFMDSLYLLNSDPQCLERYLKGMAELEEHTPVWPPPNVLLWTGDKVILANTLTRIAAEITHTLRPPTHRLPPNPIGPASAGFVRKRGYSAHADHVVFDRPTGVNSVDDLPLIPSPSGSALIDESWHEQEFIDTLHDPRFGELRCYVVGGEMRRVLKTVPVDGELRCELVEDDHPTLEQYYKSYRGHNSEDQDPTPRHHSGLHELKTFVLATHAALVEKEKQALGLTRTDLEVLCRIDVGIWMVESAAHYFVLEVERGLTTCMFAYEDQEGAAANIEEVAKVLLDWVA